MPKSLVQRKRGRPPRHPPDVLRTKIWFHVVKLRSGLPSAHAIEVALEPLRFAVTDDGIRRPSKWEGYEDGSRVPQRMRGKAYAVDLAEGAFSGTAEYFDTLLWPVLKNGLSDVLEIERMLLSLNSDVVAALGRPPPQVLRRAEEFDDLDEDAASKLVAIGSLDALTAALLFIYKAELFDRISLHAEAVDCYWLIRRKLELRPELETFAPQLFKAINDTYVRWLLAGNPSSCILKRVALSMPPGGGGTPFCFL